MSGRFELHVFVLTSHNNNFWTTSVTHTYHSASLPGSLRREMAHWAHMFSTTGRRVPIVANLSKKLHDVVMCTVNGWWWHLIPLVVMCTMCIRPRLPSSCHWIWGYHSSSPKSAITLSIIDSYSPQYPRLLSQLAPQKTTVCHDCMPWHAWAADFPHWGQWC